MNHQTDRASVNSNNGFPGDGRRGFGELDEAFESEHELDVELGAVDEERRPPVLVDEGDMVGEVEQERGEKQGKGRGRRAAVGFIVLLGIVGCAVGGWLMIGNGATRKAKVSVNNASQGSGVEREEAMTRQAIEQANAPGPGITFSDGTVVRPSTLPSDNGLAPASNVPVTQIPPVINGDLSSTVKSTQPAASGDSGSENSETKQSTGRAIAAAILARNSERSVRIGEELKATPDPRGGAGAREGSAGDVRRDPSGVALPSFGSMLPVKSLGVLYTLRSGGLVRLELTRDVKGKGWSMPRGTVLVGAMRGAEYDRAFVSLVGFIDTESGRFVKISGDLLGSDGGAGIRGKRRKMSSGWSRALSKLGEAGLNVAGALAGSVGRRPIVINDAFGSYSGRVSNELDGAFTGRDRNSFVEVAAGSSGYIMITELPGSIQGVDALAKLTGRDVEERSNPDEPRRTTGISERELAELIQSGDPERIKEMLPRMSADMRRVAEAVVSGDVSSR